MSDETLEKLISGYMATAQPQYNFNWQGGEPLLMGAGFYKKVIELQKKHGKRGSVVVNTLQTNNTVISDELAGHFAEYNFLLGVSLDGPARFHDIHRTYPGGRGSHAEVLKGIECLNRNKVEFNALTLVTSANAGRAQEVYGYLRGLGLKFHQYIPCVEFDGHGNPENFAVTGAQWGGFICGIYDEWIKKDVYDVSVRLFDSVLSVLTGHEATVCQMRDSCCQYFVVEYNGDVYPCDFFVEKDRKLGNIMEDSWEKIAESRLYLDFGKLKSACDEKCPGCGYFRFCRGDCLKYRHSGGSGFADASWLCDGWKMFYTHALPGFKKIASELQQHAKQSTKITGLSQGRNPEATIPR